VEEVLPALQQATAAQGIEVTVATEALGGPKGNWITRTVAFVRDVRAEVRKVTWPTRPELLSATRAIVIFVAILGLVIGWMDWVLQQIFVVGLAKLF
jgi:preprotein translocase SecE subunit